jgi:hypothetical protein
MTFLTDPGYVSSYFKTEKVGWVKKPPGSIEAAELEVVSDQFVKDLTLEERKEYRIQYKVFDVNEQNKIEKRQETQANDPEEGPSTFLLNGEDKSLE